MQKFIQEIISQHLPCANIHEIAEIAEHLTDSFTLIAPEFVQEFNTQLENTRPNYQPLVDSLKVLFPGLDCGIADELMIDWLGVYIVKGDSTFIIYPSALVSGDVAEKDWMVDTIIDDDSVDVSGYKDKALAMQGLMAKLVNS